MNVHRQRAYCMRQQEEGNVVSSPIRILSLNEKHPDRTSRSMVIMDALKSLWGERNVLRLTSGGSSSKKHRFLEVTDPALDHIVSQSRAKAITSEDDLVAEMLKKEAYRVAVAHTQGADSKKSSQAFYTEGDVHAATHHSPVHPIFYESKARSVKIEPPLTRPSIPTPTLRATAPAPQPSSSSRSSPATEEKTSVSISCLGHSASPIGSYPIANAKIRSTDIDAVNSYSSPGDFPSNRWGRSDASEIS